MDDSSAKSRVLKKAIWFSPNSLQCKSSVVKCTETLFLVISHLQTSQPIHGGILIDFSLGAVSAKTIVAPIVTQLSTSKGQRSAQFFKDLKAFLFCCRSPHQWRRMFFAILHWLAWIFQSMMQYQYCRCWISYYPFDTQDLVLFLIAVRFQKKSKKKKTNWKKNTKKEKEKRKWKKRVSLSFY